MKQLLEEAIEEVRTLPEDEQDRAAQALIAFARERLEDTNRRHPRQCRDVGTSRDVNRAAESGEHVGDRVVRQPPRILDSGGGQAVFRVLRIPHPVNARRDGQARGRLDQELVDLGGALAVTPVADPDEIAVALPGGERTEHLCVRGFVPRPRPP